jgi:hypothetical protein
MASNIILFGMMISTPDAKASSKDTQFPYLLISPFYKEIVFHQFRYCEGFEASREFSYYLHKFLELRKEKDQ